MQIPSECERRRAGAKAALFFGNGYHCAEAVTAAVLATMGEASSEAVAHATAFGGGIGRTHEETCGALSGALIAIGHLYGRRQPGGAWDCAAKLGAAMRQRFVDEFGTAHCQTLRQRFGEARQMPACRRLTRWVAVTLLELLAAAPVHNVPVAPVHRTGGRQSPAGIGA